MNHKKGHTDHTQVHKWLGEVDHRFTCIVDGHRSDGQIRILIDDLAHKAIPFAGSRVLGTELVEVKGEWGVNK